MLCRIFVLIAALLVGSIKCQDVAIPGDLLPTIAPKTTTTTTEQIVSYDETTLSDFDDDHTHETPTLSPPENQQKGENGDDDNLGEWKNTPPLNILPPSDDDDCDLPPKLDPIPLPVPPIYTPSTDKPEHEIINQCPIGFILNGTKCTSQYPAHNCPSGYEWRDERCLLSQIVCPLNFDFDGSSCVERQICPPNHIWKDNKCITPEPQCPPGYKWNSLRCEVATIQCQPGSVLRGNECVIESITCPSGFTLINNQCIKPPPRCEPGYELQESGFCSQKNIKCPSGSVLINGECQRVSISCPPGFQEIGNQCYPIAATTTTTQKPSHPHDIPQICPEGFRFYQGQCYRCPSGYSFCRGKCVKTPKSCENSGSSQNSPPININVNINFTRPIYYDHEGSQKNPINIFNNMEPINTTIVNFNNVTHPVTLNNVNENNIYIYTEVECEDGSIRTTVVKNNETITSCIDSEQYLPEKNEMTTVRREDEENSAEVDENKCCEIVTPRQCKKRSEDQWICTHRRYKYCGKFCIADRLYMRPPTTTYNNKILTMAPAPQNHWIKPCYGHGCPPVDCTGCMNGSFNCSLQCYTYPCTGTLCTYIDAEDFCENVGGSMCR